jgi:hypothetical protein
MLPTRLDAAEVCRPRWLDCHILFNGERMTLELNPVFDSSLGTRMISSVQTQSDMLVANVSDRITVEFRKRVFMDLPIKFYSNRDIKMLFGSS